MSASTALNVGAGTSPAQAKRMALIALGGSAVLATVSDIGGKGNARGPRLRVLLGAVVAGVLLSWMADFGLASLAAALAAVILVSSFLVYGGDAWKRIGKVVGA